MNQSWITQVVNSHRDTESPERFWYWSAISAIGATLGKQIYVNRWIYKLYPNLYIFLVAGSGMKKSPPVNLAKNLCLLAGGVRTVSGRTSVQKVIEDLSKAYSLEGGGVIKNAHGYIVNSELAAFLVKDPDALSILTDVFDTHNYEREWKYSLKSGEYKLKEPCINWLGATNEEHFEDCVPPVQVKGGFVGRLLIVHSMIPGAINSLVDEPKNLVDLNIFVPFLKNLQKISGEVKWTKDGGEYFKKWYNEYGIQDHYDKTGASKRIGDAIIKVAMCIGMANGYDMELKQKYIEEAKAQCLECLGGTNKVTMGSGKGNLTDLNKIAMRMLLKEPSHQVNRKTFARRFWNEGYGANELDMVITILLESNAISVGGDTKDPIYILKESVIKHYGEIAS